MEELAVGTSMNFINMCGLQIYEHCLGHKLTSSCLTEGVEALSAYFNSLGSWHLAIRLDAIFEAIELPAGLADLCTQG